MNTTVDVTVEGPSLRGKYKIVGQVDGRSVDGYYYVASADGRCLSANGGEAFFHTENDRVVVSEEEAVANAALAQHMKALGVCSMTQADWEEKMEDWDDSEADRVRALGPKPSFEEWRKGRKRDRFAVLGQTLEDQYQDYIHQWSRRPVPKSWWNAYERAGE